MLPVYLAALLLLASYLPAEQPQELPVMGTVVQEGVYADLDLASFPRQAESPRDPTCRSMEVAVALGAMPEIAQEHATKRSSDPLRFVVAGGALPPPLADQPLGLVVIGPLIGPDHQQCQIESIRRLAGGVAIGLGVWSGPAMASTQAHLRPAWMLRLPAQAPGPYDVQVHVRWHDCAAVGGVTGQQGLVGGALVTARLATTVDTAVGGRASASLPLVMERFRRPLGGEAWLPRALCRSHNVQSPSVLAGLGILGVRQLDIDAVAAAFGRGDGRPIEELLILGSNPAPVLLVSGPELDRGGWTSLRSATWNGADRLEVTLAVWYDDRGRDANQRHRETWLLPMHRPTGGDGKPPRVSLIWESRILDRHTGWYEAHPGAPRGLPAQAVMTWDGSAEPGTTGNF